MEENADHELKDLQRLRVTISHFFYYFFYLFIYLFIYFIYLFLCPRLPKAGVGHIAFHRDVTCVCHVRNQVQVYPQV